MGSEGYAESDILSGENLDKSRGLKDEVTEKEGRFYLSLLLLLIISNHFNYLSAFLVNHSFGIFEI